MEAAIDRRAQAPAQEVPYPPSWVDRVTNWVEHLPIPWWSFYVLLAAALSGATALGLWRAGVYATTSSRQR